MWPSSKQNKTSTGASEKQSFESSTTMDSGLVADCPSGEILHDSQQSYGYSSSDQDNQQKWGSKSSHMLDHNTAGYSSSNLCDSGRTDSGFLSGANITSEQSITDDYSTSQHHQISKHNFRDSGIQELPSETDINSSSSMRLDSGIVDIDEKFSDLSIKKTHLNDLNNSPSLTTNKSLSSSSQYTDNSTPIKEAVKQPPSNVEEPPTPINPAWELYFQQDEDGDTQLHIAIIQGFIEVVYSLIHMAPHQYFLDIPNDFHQTPLHLAVMTQQAHIVRKLLIAGASPDARDRHGNTALHLACQLGATACVGALLQPVTVAETQNVRLSYKVTGPIRGPSSLEERNYDGQLCLHLAAAGGHVDVMRHLVWLGADVNSREGKCGRTALHVAAERGQTQVSLYLIFECPNVDLTLITYAGYTAYQLAFYGDPGVAHKLAARGVGTELPESDSESESDEEDEMYARHLPNEGFFMSLNGTANCNLISA